MILLILGILFLFVLYFLIALEKSLIFCFDTSITHDCFKAKTIKDCCMCLESFICCLTNNPLAHELHIFVGGITMSKNEHNGARTCNRKCEFCGKMPQSGHHVSHSNIKTKRRFNPNLQRVRHQKPDGGICSVLLCTRCIRSGVVTKPAPRTKQA